jgi:hypothetical protein
MEYLINLKSDLKIWFWIGQRERDFGVQLREDRHDNEGVQ